MKRSAGRVYARYLWIGLASAVSVIALWVYVSGVSHLETTISNPRGASSGGVSGEPSSTSVVGSESAIARAMQDDGAKMPVLAVSGTGGFDSRDIERSVEEWSKAWSSKDTQAYLGFYSHDFDTRDQTREQWEAERIRKIGRRKFIHLTLSDMKIDVEDDVVRVRFKQRYESEALKEEVQKQLKMKKQSGKWMIIQESVLKN